MIASGHGTRTHTSGRESDAAPQGLLVARATGEGREKWIHSPTPFRTLRALLSKYVGPNVVNGLTANIYHMATGRWPGKHEMGHDHAP